MPGWFSLAMGITGLSLAWHRAVPTMCEPAVQISPALGGLALLLFTLLALASRACLQRNPEALAEDFKIRCGMPSWRPSRSRCCSW